MSALVANPPAKAPEQAGPRAAQSRGDLCFIETQFPISKISKESYKERKAANSQTLPGLGRWWARKPLVLCRATILGLLLPATDNPQKDREVFLRLMTMDEDGMLRRKSANIPAKELFKRLPGFDRERFFDPDSTEGNARLVPRLSKEEKQEIQQRVFLSMSYDERLEYCDRPEQVDGPSPESWEVSRGLLRIWEKMDVVPRAGDIFGERLYCIRWTDTWTAVDKHGEERVNSKQHYCTPTKADMNREKKVLGLLTERLEDWQKKGFIPSRRIDSGAETTRLGRERGWTYWNHLFTPRQLLVLGSLNEEISKHAGKPAALTFLLLGLGKCADYNSRLSRWHPRTQGDIGEQVFSNQALNTLFNYCTRGLSWIETTFKLRPRSLGASGKSMVEPQDARVNKSHAKLVRARQPVDITLFTIKPDKRRRYVATIHAVECLDDQQAKDALKAFQQRGWYDTMRKEIRAVKGDESALGAANWPTHALNVRFRLENLKQFSPRIYAPPGDPMTRLTRYQLYDLPRISASSPPTRRRSGTTKAPKAQTYQRAGAPAVECTPEHARMQAQLMKELKAEFPSDSVVREEDFVDVTVQTHQELILFEIKSDLEPRSVIRQALGQILEYAYHPNRKHNLRVRLIIVGRCPPTDLDRRYLKRLRKEFALPLAYRVVKID